MAGQRLRGGMTSIAIALEQSNWQSAKAQFNRQSLVEPAGNPQPPSTRARPVVPGTRRPQQTALTSPTLPERTVGQRCFSGNSSWGTATAAHAQWRQSVLRKLVEMQSSTGTRMQWRTPRITTPTWLEVLDTGDLRGGGCLGCGLCC